MTPKNDLIDPLGQYQNVWLVEFQFDRPSGERPLPLELVAKEYRSGQFLRLGPDELPRAEPPYLIEPDSMLVAYDASVPLGCHLALGWPMPKRILDLHAEFRWLMSGLEVPNGDGLAGALKHFRLEGDGLDGLAKLLQAMLPKLDMSRALLRGRYLAAVARMEAAGVPIDVERLELLRNGWEGIQDEFIRRVDCNYGVYIGRKFNPLLWRAWLNRRHIPWRRLSNGNLVLNKDIFSEMARTYPEIRPMKELRATLSQMRSFRLPVGQDGRNRCPLRPFASKTGRNQPSTSEFIFSLSKWLRGLIRPEKGMALAYLDFEQQEFGIAAALSKDPAMMDAYRSGDPYLAFAKQAGVVPAQATKASHRDERERFKVCALGVQYGMGTNSLAMTLRISLEDARKLLRLHKATYPMYWCWSDEVTKVAREEGKQTASFGWNLNVGPKSKSRSLRNWPLQANGAEMLRLACCFLTESDVRVCAPVHDAFLVEAPSDEIEQVVAYCQEKMQEASTLVLPNFQLRTEVKIVQFPERYLDTGGKDMWNLVFELLDQEATTSAA
jgi:hypothetical protein